MMGRTLLLIVLAAGCRAHAPVRPPAAPPAAPPSAPPASTGLGGLPVSRRTSTGPLTPTERDSLRRETAAHRATWRARGIASYRIQVAVGCFCSWPGGPAVLEVKNGTPVALRDTTGKSMGKLREPWSLYTVDGLFDMVEQGVQQDDVIEVDFDSTYGYPTWIHGDMKVGYPDDWFYVRATRLTRF